MRVLGHGKFRVHRITPKGIQLESYMRFLKKSLAALVSEDGKDRELFSAAVALAYNSTPHTLPSF